MHLQYISKYNGFLDFDDGQKTLATVLFPLPNAY